MGQFVSHDGEGTEVFVITLNGAIVDRIKKKDNTTLVEFTTPKDHPVQLQYPVSGYISNTLPEDQAIIGFLTEAENANTPVDIRIEAARKAHVDKSIPIATVREGEPTKDIIRRLVGINNMFSSERLTSPADDPKTGGGVAVPLEGGAPRAAGQASGGAAADVNDVLTALRNAHSVKGSISAGVIDNLIAQALVAGATVADIQEAAASSKDNHNQPTGQVTSTYFAKEAPPYSMYNQDNRLNLGYATSASAGVMGVVMTQFHKNNPDAPINEATVEFFAKLILSISDTIQVGAYGNGFKVDRSTGSHTRVRFFIFGLIETTHPLPLDGTEVGSVEDVKAWMKEVGATARARFLKSVELGMQCVPVSAVLASLTPEEEQAAAAPAASAEPTPAEPAPEPVTQPEPAPEVPAEPVAAPASAAVEAPVEPVASPVAEAPAMNPGLPPQNLLPLGYLTNQNKATEETLEEFKSFVIDHVGYKTKTDQAKVKALLSYIHGPNYSSMSSTPEDELGELLDFYVAEGPELFRAHAEAAAALA